MEPNTHPVRFVSLIMAEVSGCFFIFFNVAVMHVFHMVKTLTSYRNCDSRGVHRNGKERKESYFLSYPISYLFLLLGARHYGMFCLWYRKPHLLWLDIKWI